MKMLPPPVKVARFPRRVGGVTESLGGGCVVAAWHVVFGTQFGRPDISVPANWKRIE